MCGIRLKLIFVQFRYFEHYSMWYCVECKSVTCGRETELECVAGGGATRRIEIRNSPQGLLLIGWYCEHMLRPDPHNVRVTDDHEQCLECGDLLMYHESYADVYKAWCVVNLIPPD